MLDSGNHLANVAVEGSRPMLLPMKTMRRTPEPPTFHKQYNVHFVKNVSNRAHFQPPNTTLQPKNKPSPLGGGNLT